MFKYWIDTYIKKISMNTLIVVPNKMIRIN